MVSKVHSHISGGKIKPLEMTKVGDAAVGQLAQLGIHISPSIVHQQVAKIFAGDANFIPSITTPSIPTPIQFLQTWLPGFVKIMTAARKIDQCIGITTVGKWEDEEIVQGIVEPSGTPKEYGDTSNVPLASWNTNFERRSVVRGELGMQVGMLEEARASAMNLSSSEEKRQGAGISLEIMRNAIGFTGWDGGLNRTFGLLNDPSLLAYDTVAGGPWAAKDYLGITADIRLMIQTLRTQSQDTIDPENTSLVMLIATAAVDYLSVTSDFGISVRDWLTQTYPKVRVESAPEFNLANAAANVMYLYAETIDASADGSNDGGAVFKQLVQSKFMTLGVEKRAKSYVEAYSNATAGVLLTRPYAVVRVSGI